MSAGGFSTTLLDRAITRVSPERGLRRMSARLKVESLGRFFGGGSYQGARSDRRSMRRWNPLSRSADSDAVPDLPDLRSRSLDLYRNDPLATGAINTKVTSIVGSGLMLQAQLDRSSLGIGDEEASAWERKAERIFALAASQIDITRRQQFGALQSLVWRSKLLSGDVLVLRRFVQRRGDLLGVKIQI
ncbi:MAG: phage portal protein, partial [Dehalococcoidia bacterium]